MTTEISYQCSACHTPITNTALMTCPNCGVDFGKVGPTPIDPVSAVAKPALAVSPPTPTWVPPLGANAQPRVPRSGRRKAAYVAVAVVVVLLLVAGALAPHPTPAAAVAGAPTPGGGAVITNRPDTAGTMIASVGETVTVGGLSFLVQKASYSTQGIVAPPAGEVYIGYLVTITATSDNQFVNASAFKVAADGVQQGQQFAFGAPTDWQPLVTFDTLNAGRSDSGWLTFQVPTPRSTVVLTYAGNIFGGGTDWQLTSNCCH